MSRTALAGVVTGGHDLVAGGEDGDARTLDDGNGSDADPARPPGPGRASANTEQVADANVPPGDDVRRRQLLEPPSMSAPISCVLHHHDCMAPWGSMLPV
jgi:hypothetical protein